MEAREIKRPFDDRIVSQLRRSLFEGQDGLRTVPEMLKSVIEHEIWRQRVVEETGELVRFESFEDFVTAPPLEGLGASVRQLKQLCQDDKEARDALVSATVGEHGTNQYTKPKSGEDNHNITHHSTGTSTDYALRKLRRDRPDLHEKVLEGRLSPNRAMIQAGFREKTFTVPENLDKAARVLAKHFDPDELYGAMIEARS